jgi:hypothetical protein
MFYGHVTHNAVGGDMPLRPVPCNAPVVLWKDCVIGLMLRRNPEDIMALDDKTRTELEAAVYRRLVEHLRARTDVQNIDLMNLAGFCRNCLSNWMKDAADANGVAMSKEQSREIVYGMPYDEWRAKYQKEASPEQKAAFEKSGVHRH